MTEAPALRRDHREYSFEWQYVVEAEPARSAGAPSDSGDAIAPRSGQVSAAGTPASTRLARLATVALALLIWLVPPPEG